MAKANPKVKQCQDEKHWLFGAVAVAAGTDRWGVMHPENGGHWAKDAEVEAWKVLT